MPVSSRRLGVDLLLLALWAVSMCAVGCMTGSYRVSPQELERLSQLPPGERGDKVRVLQRWSTQPAPAPVTAGQRQSMAWSGQVNVISIGHRSGMHAHRVVSWRGHTLARGGPFGSHGGVGHGGVVHAGRPVEGPRAAPGVSGVKPVEPLDTTGNGPGSGGGGGGGLSIGDGEAIVYVVVAIAVAATVYLALTEGLRHDGWVHLEEGHPVHLMYEDGSERAVALWDLEASDLAGVEEAVILDEEGPMELRGLAPLNRVGMAWRMEGGASQVTLPRGDAPFGGGALIGVGFFPLQWLGLFATSTLMASTDGTFVDIQLGAELDVIPLAFGPLNLGVYGAGGMGFTILERASGSDANEYDPWLQTGGLIELELTTRMTISSHLGAMFQQRDDAFLDPTFLGTIGLTIY